MRIPRESGGETSDVKWEGKEKYCTFYKTIRIV